MFSFEDCIDHIEREDGADGKLGPFLWTLPWPVRKELKEAIQKRGLAVKLPLALLEEHKRYYMAPGDLD